jgi:hypothetical protein
MAQLPYTAGAVDNQVIYDEITADVLFAAAKVIPCFGAKAIALQFIEGGTVNNRSGVLSIQVSGDGTNFTTYSMLISNTANTNSQTITRVASLTRNSAGNDVIFFSPESLGAITHFKAQIAITDSALPTGNFTLIANIQY